MKYCRTLLHTLSDDDRKLIVVDGILCSVVLGLEIFGKLVDDTSLTKDLGGNILLESLDEDIPGLLAGVLLLEEPRPLPLPTNAEEWDLDNGRSVCMASSPANEVSGLLTPVSLTSVSDRL